MCSSWSHLCNQQNVQKFDFLANWTQNACGDGGLWELMWRTFYTRCHQRSTHFHHKTSINVLCWRVLLPHDLGDHNIIVQVVDSKKQFTKLFVGLLGSVTNSKILRRSTLYKHAQYQGLFNPQKNMDVIPPYLLGDKGYFLIF